MKLTSASDEKIGNFKFGGQGRTIRPTETDHDAEELVVTVPKYDKETLS